MSFPKNKGAGKIPVGIFKNVLLSKREINALSKRRGYSRAIKMLSCYKKFEGICSCENDFEVLSRWCKRYEERLKKGKYDK